MVENEEPLTYVRKVVWGTLYADDAGVVSKSAEGLGKMMAVKVKVFQAATSRYRKIRDDAITNTEPYTPGSTARP